MFDLVYVLNYIYEYIFKGLEEEGQKAHHIQRIVCTFPSVKIPSSLDINFKLGFIMKLCISQVLIYFGYSKYNKHNIKIMNYSLQYHTFLLYH